MDTTGAVAVDRAVRLLDDGGFVFSRVVWLAKTTTLEELLKRGSN